MDATPGRIFKKTNAHKRAVNVFLSNDLYDRLEAIADRETRTLTAQVTHYVKRALAADDDPALTSTNRTET